MARLAAGIRVGALLRRIEAEGGFGAVLAKGDEMAGAILIICAQRGVIAAILERAPGTDENYTWQRTAEQLLDNQALLNDYFTKRRRNDPDLWLIELDVPDAERFVSQLTSSG